MPGIKLVIFDLDGTLVDAYRAIRSSFNYTMCKLGLKPRGPETIRRSVGWGDSNLLKPYTPPDKLSMALKMYRRHHKKSLVLLSRLYPYAGKLLNFLKSRGYKLAVASNRPSKFSFILLKHLGIAGLFDCVVCADQLERGKPDPQILNEIVKRLGIRKCHALYVGDMVIDAQAGRRAGIKTIVITGGSSPAAELKRERPFKVCSGLDRLLKLFRKIPGPVSP